MNDYIQTQLNTNNWFDFSLFYDKVSQVKHFNTFVELGVWKGHSVCYLGNKLKEKQNIKIYAVDLWEDTYKYENTDLAVQKPYLFDIFTENVKRNNLQNLITPIKCTSWEASKKFENSSVDFVFIDADHEYDSVKKDIEHWLPKVKAKGIIAGHDYFNPCGVKQAVDEMFKGSNIQFCGNCWYIKI